MRSRSLALVAGFGLLLVVAIGMRGTASFSGVRWLPDWTLPRSTAKPPQATLPPPPSAAPARVPKPAAPLEIGPILLVVAAVVVIIVALLVLRWWLRRRRHLALEAMDATIGGLPLAKEPEPDAPVLRRGFDLALHVLDTEREPRDAIVKAWLGLQDAAEDSGIRRAPAETPTEFTSRIRGMVVSDERSVVSLLRWYHWGRFGDHPATEQDVASARASLESLAASWRDESAPVDRGRGEPR